MLIAPDIDTHEYILVSELVQRLFLKITTIALVNVIVISIATVRTKIMREIANGTMNTHATIVTTLAIQMLTKCRFSTSDALAQGGFQWACKQYLCFGAYKPDGVCLTSAEMQVW